MSVPPAVARSCASCQRTDATLRCAGCHALFYCSCECKKAHWISGGHTKDCKGFARARLDTNVEAQSRALARVSHMSGGAPDDAHCLICLDRGDAKDPLVRGCACRGTSGWAHVMCLIKMAEAARAPLPPDSTFAAWERCSTCKQDYTGLVQMRLAIALWAKYARSVETSQDRLHAVSAYAAALGKAGEHAEGVRLQRGVLDVQTRKWGLEHDQTLTCASNMAASLMLLGEYAEAAVLLRTTLAAQTSTVGVDNDSTLLTEGHLISALIRLGENEEAEALGRGSLEKMRRVLGRDHHLTLSISSILASSLSAQGKDVDAAEIRRELLVQEARLLGADHESTLITAYNLSFSLLNCGELAECVQILHDSLPLAQRALGPAHVITQRLLKGLRLLDLAAL